MVTALVFFIALMIVCFVFFYFHAKERLSQESLSQAKQKSSQLQGQIDRAENEINFMRLEKEKIEVRMTEKIDSLQEKILHFEKQNTLLKQEQEQLERQKQEWFKDKEAILFQLAEELMKKNIEQQSQLSTYQQDHIKKITEDLFKNFENVTNKLSAIDDQVKKSSRDIDQTKAALLSPSGSGRTSEITLENILKNSNLLEKESLTSVGDYILQSHFSSANMTEGKRPDAIIFLPNDQIFVIDSKSSPYFFELVQAQGNEEKKEILAKIKISFRKHLEDLKRKDYANFLFEELRSKNSADFKIHSVIFLQTEQMLDVIRNADRDFEQNAFDAGISVATPISLINLLSNMKFVIDRVKQEKNIEILKVEVRKMLDNLTMILRDSQEVGKGLNRALTSYNKLAKGLNRSVALGKNISELGIEGKKSDQLRLLEEYDES